MRNVVSAPLFLRLGARLRGPKETTKVGTLRRIIISNLVCWNTASKLCSILSGIPGSVIEDVSIHDVLIVCQGGGRRIRPQSGRRRTKYPEPEMFGPMRAFGFYVRHLKGLSMSNVQVKTIRPDARPAIWLEDVDGADFSRIQAQTAAGTPVFSLHQVRNFAVRDSEPAADTRLPYAQNVTLPVGKP